MYDSKSDGRWRNYVSQDLKPRVQHARSGLSRLSTKVVRRLVVYGRKTRGTVLGTTARAMGPFARLIPGL